MTEEEFEVVQVSDVTKPEVDEDEEVLENKLNSIVHIRVDGSMRVTTRNKQSTRSMMREPVKKSPPVQRKQVREVPPVQHDESDEAVPVQEGGGVGTADDPADQGHGVRDGDAHDGGQDRPKKPPDADNGGDGPVHTEGGGQVSVQDPIDEGGGAASVQNEEERDVAQNIADIGDVHIHNDEGGGAIQVTERGDVTKDDEGNIVFPIQVDNSGGTVHVQTQAIG